MSAKTEHCHLESDLTLHDRTTTPLSVRAVNLTLIKQDDEVIECRLTFKVSSQLYQRIETEALFNLKPHDPGETAALRTLIDEKVPLTIGSYNLSVAQMDELWKAVATKYKNMKKQGTWSNWKDFYKQMQTLKDAEKFLVISLK